MGSQTPASLLVAAGAAGCRSSGAAGTRWAGGTGRAELEQYLVLKEPGAMTVSESAAWLGTTFSAAAILTQRMARAGLVSR
ncbi:protein of unknown function [Candidatus Hydrogenisulfobacillus filiaventi]|uniref:Uncharacterized protein n=1 Tax=Candidatus Hydrogenisulfobacillus filiaventi TaxID=2707344 RepID=A0A6F8ZC78_9FIRM|nr:hypothetical protein [Bacillota bacterium]CAB1127531.1 protein of unknown function [Candidatus Hydrogenisulfobacillus filiaventi]